MQAGTRSERPAAQSIDAILRLEKQDEETLAVHHRLFHWIGWFVGTIQFIVLQCAFVLGWIILSHFFPHHAFDEYPFPLLATILALEAVLLTSCVLTLVPSRRFSTCGLTVIATACGCATQACDGQQSQRIARYQAKMKASEFPHRMRRVQSVLERARDFRFVLNYCKWRRECLAIISICEMLTE